MTAICKLRFSYLGLLRLLPNRFNGPVLAENGISGMYGPPPRRKRKVRIAGKVCAYVYGLVGVFNDPGPGWNALRSVPI
jgi:hypothetical protein